MGCQGKRANLKTMAILQGGLLDALAIDQGSIGAALVNNNDLTFYIF